jgi:hypothetical protein
MIRLHVHPLLPLPLVTGLAKHRKTEKERQFADGKGRGEGAGVEPNFEVIFFIDNAGFSNHAVFKIGLRLQYYVFLSYKYAE